MTSNDIIIEGINGLEKKIVVLQQDVQNMRQEIKDTRNELLTEIRVNQAEAAHIQTSVYWGFAIMGVVIGLVGLIVAILALNPLKRERTERSEDLDLSPRNIRDIRIIVREEIAIANSIPIAREN